MLKSRILLNYGTKIMDFYLSADFFLNYLKSTNSMSKISGELAGMDPMDCGP